MAKKPPSPGTAFENAIADTAAAYLVAGIARLEKVSPPCRVIHIPPPGRPRVVFLENPFLDFTGIWTAAGGRSLHIEAKFTTSHLLSLGDGGLTKEQLDNALAWEAQGAAVAFLWRRGADTRLITPRMALAATLKRRSVRWVDAVPVPQGRGFILIDFLAVLARLKPELVKP